MCRLLLANGAQAGVVDSNGYSPLHYAAQNGFPVICQILVASMKYKMEGGWNAHNAQLLINRSPLANQAFFAGLATSCRWMCEGMRRCCAAKNAHKKVTMGVTKKSKAVPSPLALSVLECHTKCVDVLLKSGYNTAARIRVGDETMPSPYDSALLAFHDMRQSSFETTSTHDETASTGHTKRRRLSRRESFASAAFLVNNESTRMQRQSLVTGQSRQSFGPPRRKRTGSGAKNHRSTVPDNSNAGTTTNDPSEHRHMNLVREKRRSKMEAMVNQLNKHPDVVHVRNTFAFAHYLGHEVPQLLLFLALLVMGPNGTEIQQTAGAFILNDAQAREQVCASVCPCE